MSAYIVEAITINRIVTYLGQEMEFKRSTPLKKLVEKHIDLTDKAWKAELAQRMFTLNCDAVLVRYSHGPQEEIGDGSFSYTPVSLGTPVQMFKTIEYYLHNCNQGLLPQGVLYQFMREISHQLAVTIVSDLPAYEKAEWA
jgi:hypothetical protein